MTISYEKAAEILNGRNKRKIDNNTYLERVGEVFVIRLHNTDIIKIYPDETQVITSGGYRTATTKSRINEYSFAIVDQVKGSWYLRNEQEFFDGMRINANGEVVSELVS